MVRAASIIAVLLLVPAFSACSAAGVVYLGGPDGGDTGADTDSDTDTDTDTDADTGTDTDTNTGADECDKGEYSGDVTVGAPAVLENLAGYTSIAGTLTISCEDCVDLDDLICLTSVGDYLNFLMNSSLTSVAGLSNVTGTVGGINITENQVLTNVDGLNGITSTVVELDIFDNPMLEDLDGLSGLTALGTDLSITGNDALANLDGLSGITSIVGGVMIGENQTLPDCEVCELLDQLTTGPYSSLVQDNLDDTCTPVPDNCP